MHLEPVQLLVCELHIAFFLLGVGLELIEDYPDEEVHEEKGTYHKEYYHIDGTTDKISIFTWSKRILLPIDNMRHPSRPRLKRGKDKKRHQTLVEIIEIEISGRPGIPQGHALMLIDIHVVKLAVDAREAVIHFVSD